MGPESQISCDKVRTGTLGSKENLLPPWFTQNCVKTAAELKANVTPLIVRETTVHTNETNKPNVAKDRSRSSYEIESAVYEALQDVLDLTTNHEAKVGENAVYLKFPTRQHELGCMGFLQAVVEKFAVDIEANLVTLTYQDFLDLAQYCAAQKQTEPSKMRFHEYMDAYVQPRSKVDSVRASSSVYEDGDEDGDEEPRKGLREAASDFASNSQPNRKVPTPGQDISPEIPIFLLTDILKAAQLKARESPPARQSSPASLIIHIPELHEYLPDHSHWEFTEEKLDPSYRQDILRALKLAIHDYQTMGEPNSVILIASSHKPSGNNYKNSEHRRLATIGIDPFGTAISVVPVNSEVQRGLLSGINYEEERNEHLNLRTFKRRLRELSPLHREHLMLEPYTSWGFLKQHSEFAKLRQCDLDFSRFEGPFVGPVDEATLTTELGVALWKLQVADRRWQLLNEWDQHGTGAQDSAKQADKWEGLPKKTRKAIADIERNSQTMKFESQFLSMVINPSTIQETWDDIALELDIKAALQDVAVQSRSSNRAYGILKKGRIGGALLYGPPGTGKTHLARVLARESRRTMIFATPAEITNRYIGDTEKAVRALFNLGRLLAPAMIFIDEADSLFRQRQATDKSWERAQTNQFLTEMDGLKKYGNDTAPFVLLASNFPQHLDHAALRRVPQRLYIRLPSAEIRTRILEIQLRDEELHAEVDLVELGRLSEGYSGSDIQTLCVQAALACEVEHDKDDDNGDEASDDVKRVLRNVHFAKAVQRTAPTVSTTALSYIEPFAKEFDPIAWNKIQHDSKKNESSNRSENGNSTLRRFG